MAWRSSDLASLTSSSSTKKKSSELSSTASLVSSAANTPAKTPAVADQKLNNALPTSFPAFEADDTPTGLSLGAAIGIGICLGLFVLAIAAAVMYLVSRRRRRKRDEIVARSAENGSPGQDPDSVLEFKAIRYEPNIEVPRACETGEQLGCGQTAVPDQGPSSAASHSPGPSTVDHLWGHLYEEVGGRRGPG